MGSGRSTRVMTMAHHAPLRDGLAALMGAQPDLTLVGAATTVDQGLLDYIRLSPDVTIVDLDLPGGLELIRRIRHHNPAAKIIPLIDYEWDESSHAASEISGSAPLPKDQISRHLLSLIREIASGLAS